MKNCASTTQHDRLRTGTFRTSCYQHGWPFQSDPATVMPPHDSVQASKHHCERTQMQEGAGTCGQTRAIVSSHAWYSRRPKWAIIVIPPRSSSSSSSSSAKAFLQALRCWRARAFRKAIRRRFCARPARISGDHATQEGQPCARSQENARNGQTRAIVSSHAWYSRRPKWAIIVITPRSAPSQTMNTAHTRTARPDALCTRVGEARCAPQERCVWMDAGHRRGHVIDT